MATRVDSDRAGIRLTIQALTADGWQLNRVAWDGDYEQVTGLDDALDLITDLDDSLLVVRRGEESGWVRFVLGNDPAEVVCDYTVNLEVVDRMLDNWDMS